jgi:hypothetical protein
VAYLNFRNSRLSKKLHVFEWNKPEYLFVGGKAAYLTNYFKISKTIRIDHFLVDI